MSQPLELAKFAKVQILTAARMLHHGSCRIYSSFLCLSLKDSDPIQSVAAVKVPEPDQFEKLFLRTAASIS